MGQPQVRAPLLSDTFFLVVDSPGSVTSYTFRYAVPTKPSFDGILPVVLFFIQLNTGVDHMQNESRQPARRTVGESVHSTAGAWS